MPPGESVTADDLILGISQTVERAHLHGIKRWRDHPAGRRRASIYTENGEAIRQAVNRWIRTSGVYDAVIDFGRRPRSCRPQAAAR
jgi:hypothetical protein